MNRVLLVVLLGATAAVAADKPLVRICVAPLENHSKYSFPVDKAKQYLLSELNHKQIKSIDIPEGADVSAAMKANSCEFLLRGEFIDFVNLAPGQVASVGGIVVDDKKKFALRFEFELRKSVEEKPVYSNHSTVIDKNPKTCADDNVWEAAQSIRKYFNSN